MQCFFIREKSKTQYLFVKFLKLTAVFEELHVFKFADVTPSIIDSPSVVFTTRAFVPL